MVSGIGKFFGRAKNAMQAADDAASLADDAANAAKQATKVQLKPANKAAEKMGLADYSIKQSDFVWGSYKTIWKTSLDGEMSSTTKKILNYRNGVLGLPEGQVVTKSGKVYTRTMGNHGERIYTDANGNVAKLNIRGFEQPWQAKYTTRFYQYRSNVDGSSYSLCHTTIRRGYDKGKQDVYRTVEDANGICKTRSFEINPDGRISKSWYWDVNRQNGTSSELTTLYGAKVEKYVPKNLNGRPEHYSTSTPKWTSLSNYS